MLLEQDQDGYWLTHATKGQCIQVRLSAAEVDHLWEALVRLQRGGRMGGDEFRVDISTHELTLTWLDRLRVRFGGEFTVDDIYHAVRRLKATKEVATERKAEIDFLDYLKSMK